MNVFVVTTETLDEGYDVFWGIFPSLEEAREAIAEEFSEQDIVNITEYRAKDCGFVTHHSRLK